RGEGRLGDAREIAIGEHEGGGADDGRGRHHLAFDRARAENIDQKAEDPGKIALVRVKVRVGRRMGTEGLVGDAQRLADVEMEEIVGVPEDREGLVAVRDVGHAMAGDEQPGVEGDVKQREREHPAAFRVEGGRGHGSSAAAIGGAAGAPAALPPDARERSMTAPYASQAAAAIPTKPIRMREMKKSSLARLT